MDRLANKNAAGSAVEPRSVLKNLAGKPFVDQVAELNVVIRENGGSSDQHRESRAQQCDPVPGRPKTRAIRILNRLVFSIDQDTWRRVARLSKQRASWRTIAQAVSLSPNVWIPILNRAVVRVDVKILGVLINKQIDGDRIVDRNLDDTLIGDHLNVVVGSRDADFLHFFQHIRADILEGQSASNRETRLTLDGVLHLVVVNVSRHDFDPGENHRAEQKQHQEQFYA